MKKKISNQLIIKEQSLVEYMIENAPAVKTKPGTEKKILLEKLLKKHGR